MVDKAVGAAGLTQSGAELAGQVAKELGTVIKAIEKNETFIAGAGYGLVAAGTALDYTLALNHSPEMSMAHANLNAAANAISLGVGYVNPLVGATIGLAYAAIDQVYPGGSPGFAQAIAQGQMDIQNRAFAPGFIP
jgi:hypothetical protein